MAQLTASQQLGRLFIVTVACIPPVWGMQFLPETYQPSRPLYMLAWLAIAGAAYVGLRRRGEFPTAVSRMLLVVFALGLLLTLLMPT